MSNPKGHSNQHIKQPPTLEDLRRYLAGELSAAEQARIEKLVEEDPLVAEALDGLRASADDPAVGRSIARLRARTRERVAPLRKEPKLQPKRTGRVKPLIQPGWYLAAAAALAFLAVTVLGIWQWRNQNTEATSEPLAINQLETEATTETPPVIEVPAAREDFEKEDLEPPAKTKSLPPPPVETAQPAPAETRPTPIESDARQQSGGGLASASSPAPPIRDEEEVDDLAISDAEEKYGAEPETNEAIATQPTEAPARMGNSFRPDEIERIRQQPASPAQAREKPAKSSSNISYKDAPENQTAAFGAASRDSVLGDLLQLAIAQYQQGQWASSLANSQEVLMGWPENAAALYYAGMASYQLDDLDQATNYLKEAIKTGDEEILDEAEWKLALLYELEGRYKKARRLLERVANRGGTRQKDAKNKLENN